MVDERLRFSRAFRDAEDVQEKLFQDAEMGFFVECGVEGEDGAGAFQAVSSEV